MKKILLSIFAFVSINSFAQTTCATAVNITTNGDYVAGTVNGTHPGAGNGWCWANNSATPNALWYTFTPPTNGVLTVSSAIPANPGGTTGIDTRLSIMTGTCGGPWTCIDGNDDVSGTDYRSAVVDLQVNSGTTYYIVWDDRWQDTAFSFNLTFTGASCFAPTVFYLPDYLSTSSADLYWDQASPTPSTYDIDWSNNFADAAGAGTIVSVPAGALTYSTANITATASSNFRYYVRANCNPELSSWAGPYYAYLPVVLPYSNDFESATNNYTDGFINFSLFESSGASTPANYADGGAGVSMYTFNSTTAVSDIRGYFRGVYMTSGETATVSFKTRLYSAATPSTMSFNLTVGDSQSAAAQTTIIQSFSNSSDTAYAVHSADFTAPSDGIYYFSIHNNSPIGATQTFLFLDTIEITTSLSSENFNTSDLTVYPNPFKNEINLDYSKGSIEKLSITDINGRIIKNIDALDVESYQLDLSNLNSGVYLLSIETNNGKTIKKIIKN